MKIFLLKTFQGMKREVTHRGKMLLAALLVILASCTENITQGVESPVFNPFDTIQYNTDSVPEVPVDPSSFLGIHQNILSVKCAVSGCHDGSFEPDYRTVQTAYSTLVYAPVVKNTADTFFTYRVVPGDTAHSWLWYRVTTSDQVLGRMPLYDTLYPAQIENIRNWILAGAPDLFGYSPAQPTFLPVFYGLVAYLPDQDDYRVDTIRGGEFINPFAVPQNSNVTIWFGIIDDYTLPFSFTFNKVAFSTDPFDFSSAVEMDLTLTAFPLYETIFGVLAPFFASTSINTSQFELNEIVYMRFYVQDSDHSFPTEFPNDGSQAYIQQYCSFIVQ
jgi:hypothetical protein